MTDHMYTPCRNSCHEVYHSYFWKMKIHEKAKLQVEMTRLAWKTESRLPSLSWFLTRNTTSSSPKWWQSGFQRGFQRATRLPNHSTYGSEPGPGKKYSQTGCLSLPNSRPPVFWSLQILYLPWVWRLILHINEWSDTSSISRRFLTRLCA